MSKKIACFIYKHLNNPSSEFIDYSDIWIHSFIREFIKKYSSIDFLRLDKYIMLTDQIISVYLHACLTKKKYSKINKVIQCLKNETSVHNFNYSFEVNVLKTIGRFIDYVFKKKDEFVKSQWDNFFYSVLEWFFVITDKREMRSFDEVIFGAIKKNIHQYNVASESGNKTKEFIKRKGKEMIKEKRLMLDNLIKKIDDENYEPEVKKEEGVVDPVNDYIMKRNYTCKFRKSPIEKMKEIIKKDREKKKKKEQEKIEKEISKNEEKKNNYKENIQPLNEPKKEEILEENIIKITEDDIEDIKIIPVKKKLNNRLKEEDEKNKEDEVYDDQDNELLEDEDDEDNEEEDHDEDDDDEDDDDNEEEDHDEVNKKENNNNFKTKEENKSSLDDDDSDLNDYGDEEEYEEIEDDEVPELVEEDEEVFPMKEEDKNIEKAYHNSIKNMHLLRQSNKQNELLGKKTNRPSIQNSFKEKQLNKKELKSKRVKYALENNSTSVYDHKKPILLQSQKKTVFPTEAPTKKSLLKNNKK